MRFGPEVSLRHREYRTAVDEWVLSDQQQHNVSDFFATFEEYRRQLEIPFEAVVDQKALFKSLRELWRSERGTLLLGVKSLRRKIDEEGNWIEAPPLQSVGGALVRVWTESDVERADRHLQEAASKAIQAAVSKPRGEKC